MTTSSFNEFLNSFASPFDLAADNVPRRDFRDLVGKPATRSDYDELTLTQVVVELRSRLRARLARALADYDRRTIHAEGELEARDQFQVWIDMQHHIYAPLDEFDQH